MNNIGNVNFVDSVIDEVNITGNVILLEPTGADDEGNDVDSAISDGSD